MVGFWDIVSGAGLSVSMLTILLFGSWRVRRTAFLLFCIFTLTAFIWRTGCWYHQFGCTAPLTTAVLDQS